MNLRCKVCGEKAAGFHFGAFTCEGCKSFFGRCCNNMSLIGECRNNKECVIDKKNRTSCKACRLRKCLTVGMSKNGSRYGRRSNWFKQFFQEAEHHASRSKKPTSEADDDDRNCAVVDENEGNMCADLRSPTSGSSHVYFTYFPQHRLNRFISYGNGRETDVWLPNSTIPFAFLNNDYFGRLLVDKYGVHGESERGRNDDRVQDGNATDPLDLSRKRRSNSEDTTHSADAKRNSPLDLSIK